MFVYVYMWIYMDVYVYMHIGRFCIHKQKYMHDIHRHMYMSYALVIVLFYVFHRHIVFFLYI